MFTDTTNVKYIETTGTVFFQGKPITIENPVEDFTGTNGCYLYAGQGSAKSKSMSLKDCHLVVAPHAGRIPSGVWLRCNRKLMANKGFQSGRKAKNTWLAGKVKCATCGHGLIHVGQGKYSYLRCHKRIESKSCEGCGTIRESEMEQHVFERMVSRLAEFQTLTGGEMSKANPKLTAAKMEMAKVESEIEKLLDTLSGANPTLLAYANRKVEELDSNRQALAKQIADLSAAAVSPENVTRISGYLQNWDSVDFEDKRQVVGGMISLIRASSDHVDIEWKI